MKKLFLIALMTLTLVSATSMPAFAGMNNAASEDFYDDLPEIEVEASEEVPEESEEASKEQDETEAPVEESKDEKSEESEPETKEAEVAESHEETKATETEIVPERTISVREDVDNTPEHPTRVIYARRNVVICDNEPIESSVAEEVPETETKETVFEAPETPEETTQDEIETTPSKIPTKDFSLPKTADFSDLMIAGVAVMVIVAAAFAVVANRRKRA